MESRNQSWLCCIYYPRLDADVTGLDPLVVIEADLLREEAVEPRVKIEEVKEDNDVSVRSEVSKASPSLEQEVCRSGRTVSQTTT